MQTKKEEWSSERCFQSNESLVKAADMLRHVADCKSTLSHEAIDLQALATQLELMTDLWNSDDLKKLSQEKFDK